MILDPVTIDWNALPQALLANFKRHEVINHCDDDRLITEILQDAVGEFQRRNEVTLYASQVTVTAEAGDFINNNLRLPVSPVTIVSIVDDAAADIAPNYRLVGRGLHGVRIYYLTGAAAALVATIDTGYTPATLPPDIRQVLMRMAGHLYEYREIYAANQDHVPDAWLNEVMAGFWMPRA